MPRMDRPPTPDADRTGILNWRVPKKGRGPKHVRSKTGPGWDLVRKPPRPPEQMLTVNVKESVYHRLLKRAGDRNQRIEQLIVEWLDSTEPETGVVPDEHPDPVIIPIPFNREELDTIANDQVTLKPNGKYVGVAKQAGTKYCAQIFIGEGRIQHLGCYSSKLDAAKAYVFAKILLESREHFPGPLQFTLTKRRKSGANL